VLLTPPPYLEYRGPGKSRAKSLLTLRAFVAYEKGENLPISRKKLCCDKFPGLTEDTHENLKALHTDTVIPQD